MSANDVSTPSKAQNESFVEHEARRIFQGLLPDEKNTVSLSSVLEKLDSHGIQRTDERIAASLDLIRKRAGASKRVSFADFVEFVDSSHIIGQAFFHRLIIPDFPAFCKEIDSIYETVKSNEGGDVARYIPQLARVNPHQFAVSVCTVDGQRYNIGQYDVPFCIQSTSKTITYCLGMEEHGEAKVHQHVGREPSGRNFNERVLNADGLPHNPLINSGAIMSASLVMPKGTDADRFDYVTKTWQRLSGGYKPGFENATYLSERATADRNFCLGYMMKETNAFPKGTDLVRTLEFYFQLCSILMTCESMSVVAATLANGGVCPVTGERIFKPENVRACLSLMMSCGMYDYSGLFGWQIGLPAKSGVAGAVLCVLPGVAGFCTWSPRLDALGNSVRGIDFFTRLTDRFAFHLFDSLVSRESKKLDPRLNWAESPISVVVKFFYAAATGDLLHVKEMVGRGVDVNAADYDKRTALHIAASEGRKEVAEYLLVHGAFADVKDRFGNTPADDAVRHGHAEVQKVLQNAVRGSTCKDEADFWFAYVDENGDEKGQRSILLAQLARCGISENDQRLKPIFDQLGEVFDKAAFAKAVQSSPLLRRIVRGELAIPEFSTFVDTCSEVFEAARANRGGALADYIPQLACVDPEKYAMCVCTIDGQRVGFGDVNEYFCVQSTCKTINYCIAQELNGVEKVHKHVGREPSGRNFNELAMNSDGQPHNPMINAGAIMTCSLVKPEEELSDRFDYVSNVWSRLSGGATVGFSNPTYLSERQTADRNFCLGYMMKEHNVFPENTDLVETLEFYFQLCSLEMSCEAMSVVAATLANGGVCPLTGERVFSAATVKNCLSLMLSCGMYDYSGECQYLMGFPAKSGVAGAVLCVIPNVMGFCTWSPRLDKLGNSVRGLDIMSRMGTKFNFHMFDTVTMGSDSALCKLDPSRHSTDRALSEYDLISAAANGDLTTVRSLYSVGVPLTASDYDDRTALHVAAANGHADLVRFLLSKNVNVHAKDRWGVTALEEAQKNKHQNVVLLFTSE